MGELDTGRLIWLSDVIDARGKSAGPHRAIVLTPKEDRKQGKPIQAVVISSKTNYAPSDEMIMIPWSRRPPTNGLRQAVRRDLRMDCRSG